MRLNKEEYEQYLSLHPKLIHYVGQKKNLIPKETSFEEFLRYSVEDKYPIRNAMYENIHLLNDYIKEHSESLTEEEKDIIRDFKYFKKGTFYVFKLTKKYALFLGDEYVYRVYALNDPFEMFFGGNRNLPVMIEAVLLPYKGKIIYDGIISNYSIRFGSGIRSSIKNDVAKAEGKYGAITELPVKIDKTKLKNSLENELLVMMKTKASRDYNWYEIENLINENIDLIPVYIKEKGRINSRKKKKTLRELGIKKQCYAMFDDTIIASCKSQKELVEKVKELTINEDDLRAIYYFKV